MDEQTFEDFKSKYLDIHDQVKSRSEDDEETELEEVDFELELIQRDEINVAYILKLLGDLQHEVHDETTQENYRQRKAEILEMIGKETQLRNKRDLLEKFIETRMTHISPEQRLGLVFSEFWNEEHVAAVRELCTDENLNEEAVNQMINAYQFSSKEPLRDTVISACNEKPKLLERKRIYKRVVSRLLEIIHKFDDDLGNFEDAV